MEAHLELHKTPTLQHFATFCGATRDETKQNFAKNRGGASGVSYERLRMSFLPDMLTLGVTIDAVRRSIEMYPNERNRQSNIGALDALGRYVRSKPFDRVEPIERRFFAIRPGLLVPVNPPFVVVAGGAASVLWPSFWKTPGKLSGMPGAVFGSILERELFSRPDFRDLELEFLDLSAPDVKSAREFKIYRRKDFPTLSDTELGTALEYFVAEFFEMKRRRAEASETKEDAAPSGLGPLFDGI